MGGVAGFDQITALPDRVGGRLVLDFLNTAEARGAAEEREFLTSYGHFAAWWAGFEQPSPATGAQLLSLADRDPDGAAATLQRVLSLREALHAIFLAALSQGQVSEDDLALVNRELCAATDHHLLMADAAGGVRDGWVAGQTLDCPLWPILLDGWDVLTTPLLDRVKECPGHACGWLFLDTSRSGTRRWCDMRTCGNRAKAANHYARTRPT
jgi:predicted RNA-binding Zn ribbon-like protein